MLIFHDRLMDSKIKQRKQEFVVFIIIARENNGNETEILFKKCGVA